MADFKVIKKDFPLLDRRIDDKPIVYLDSTASSLKPQMVIDAMDEYYSRFSVNIFRGIYKLSEEATERYELAREKVSKFIGSDSPNSVIFVRNATEAINLAAYSWGRTNIDEGDEIVSTVMEHHANIVPWQELSNETGAVLKYLDITDEGYLNLDNLKTAITPRTKLLVITYVSNVLGTINPIKEIIKRAKKINSKLKILVDAAQAVPHMAVNVKELDCDFLAFSGHKMLGPTGIGVLWGKYELLDGMIPFQMGGEMIKEVYLDHSVYKEPPLKFEAGTPHIAGAIGLGAAVDYLSGIGMENIRNHEKELVSYALDKFNSLTNATVYGPKDTNYKGGVLAFDMKGLHPHDIAQILNEDNICIRSGHHCAMPLHIRLGLGATSRASFYVYTTKEDIDQLIEGLKKANKIFKI